MSSDLQTLQLEYAHFTAVYERLQMALAVLDLTEDRRVHLIREFNTVERHLENLEREIAYIEESERFWAYLEK